MADAVRALAGDEAWIEARPHGSFRVAGRRVTARWLAGLSDQALTTFGIARAAIVETDPPAGSVVSGSTLVDAAGVPTRQWIAQEIPLEELVAARTAAVDAERDRRIDGGFVHLGAPYQTRPSDRENIAGAAQAAFMAKAGGAQAGDLRWPGGDADFVWIAADNTLVTMDVDQVLAFFAAGVAFKTALTFAGRAKKDWLLDPGRTREEILAFDPTASWPT
ncbi:MAG: DUF4376 domain-containing protein [Phenylobacterium sp.]|nr:DUF4376 domain-containing protein [Phenylobacterium sp.]